MILDLSSIPHVKNSTHWSREVDQLYHPTGMFGQDSAEIVYVKDVLNALDVQFVPIVLKEWIYLLKKDGYLIIDYKPTIDIDFDSIEKQLWWLWRGYYELISHEPVSSDQMTDLTSEKLEQYAYGQIMKYEQQLDRSKQLALPLPIVRRPTMQDEYMRLVLQKKRTTIVENDSIDKWTFGILTIGNRPEWLEKVIDSIRSQKIPHYEIVICGSYHERNDPDIVYIPYNRRAGWITKQKNLIVEHARYENICVIHDRVIFPDRWFEGMKRWGNCFEHMGVPQLINGDRAGDWLYVDPGVVIKFQKGGYFFPMRYSDYNEWSPTNYSSGSLHIGKKRVLLNTPWDETLYWNQAEDYALQQDLHRAGHLTRFNPEAKTEVLAWRFPTDRTNPSRIGPRIATVVLKLLFKVLPVPREQIFNMGFTIYYELPKRLRKVLRI